MARVPSFDGPPSRAIKQGELVRQVRSAKRCHTETKTFLVKGAITAGLYVPPFWVGVNTDGENPEYKTIYAFRGVLAAGGCTIQWLVNDVQVGDDHDITTVSNAAEVLIDPATWPAAILNDGDTIRPSFAFADSAQDLSAAVYMLTAAA